MILSSTSINCGTWYSIAYHYSSRAKREMKKSSGIFIPAPPYILDLDRALDAGGPLRVDGSEFLLVFVELVREALHDALHVWPRKCVVIRRLSHVHNKHKIFLRMPYDNVLAEFFRYFIEVHSGIICFHLRRVQRARERD